MEELATVFAELEDPRTGNAGLHDLLEILVIALCTVLCGGQTAVDMQEFGEAKEEFLRRFLGLEHGIPSHDTFSRVFRALDPEQFRVCFQRFMERFAAAAGGVVAIDGKKLRRSFDKASGRSALHMVSAWGCEQRLVLGQIAVDDKSNEITAVPKLLDLLSLKGCIVTLDALNCQRIIAERIVERGADYVLALKENQPTLHNDVAEFLNDPVALQAADAHTDTDAGHGRIEQRTATVSTDIDWLQEMHHWPHLVAIGKVHRCREIKGQATTETAYYLLSAPLTAQGLNAAARQHWCVENQLHWTLDVTFNEDQSRVRKDNAPDNLAILRHMALNIVRQETSKGSARVKLKRAGWNDAFLAKLLAKN